MDPKFAYSNLAVDEGFLWAIKIHSTTAFGGEVKLLDSCHKICSMLKNTMRIKEIHHRQNSVGISCQVSPALLLESLLPRIARDLWWMYQA
jgi:hypothetical protein